MRTTFRIIAAVAALGILTSCQKQEPGMQGTNVLAGKELVPITISASITGTRVTYTETAEEHHLQPDWVEGDKVIGFDGDGDPYEFIISSTAADGTAKLTGDAPANCTLHLIYLGSATPAVTKGLSLPINVDYTAQAGDKTMPAVMLSDGEVRKGTGTFHFCNAGAIIGIRAMKGVPSGAAISKVTVEGENLSAATVALSGSALALTATTAASDAISTATLSGITTTDANGTLSSPVFIAVPAGAMIKKVSVALQARVPETMTIPSLAADKKNIDYVEIEAKYDGTNLSTKKWAKWNVGANSQSDYGWFFPWAGTEGYVWKNNKWISASGVDTYSYTLSSAKTANASDYLYVKTQSFTTGFRFFWVDTPYQTQNTTNTSYIKFTKYLGSTSSSYKDPSATDADALKTVLDPEDDAATVNWGGTWRMPTMEEFKALMKATYWAWDATDTGYYVFKADATHTAGKRVSSIPDDLDKAYALLFFPAAGYGDSNGLNDAGSYGRYWSSSLYSPKPYIAYILFFYSGNYSANSNSNRNVGRSVRAVSD